MAEIEGAWGIEIGQAGLKAMRLRYAEAAEQVLAVAFDYVPHPKILSQPDAIPQELIAQALDTFLSRNEIRGNKIVISVPGQTALSRFIQLPPVEATKVKDIVKFEARQQIPFALEEVIWDYQNLGGGSEEGGYMLNAEVGLFAMKRDLVINQLDPFTERKVEVDLVQIAPLALYNFLSYDRMGIKRGETMSYDEYTIILDMGAETTTLLVSNGEKIWIRNVPIGGNQFTRALTKEMKLTFAKAEHLKCNATKSPDPRAVFQALRPVFNDYVSEIQRSIGFFSNVNRSAKITKVLGVGNGFKMAGLQKFLEQNLQYEVERVESFSSVIGDSVLNAGLFQDNIMGFVVPYGLALQGLDLTRIETSLIPPEIVAARKIREKKPWAITAAAIFLAATATSSFGYSRADTSVGEKRFSIQEQEAQQLTTDASTFKTNYVAQETASTDLDKKELSLVGPLSEADYMAELLKAINESLPRDEGAQQFLKDETPADIMKKNRIKITSHTTERLPNVKTWYEKLKVERPAALKYMTETDLKVEPTGPGLIVTLYGRHYHHDETDRNKQGVLYVVDFFLKNLQQWTLKDRNAGQVGGQVPIGQMGISHATITDSFPIEYIDFVPESQRQQFGIQPGAAPSGDFGIGAVDQVTPGTVPENGNQKTEKIPETKFKIQFVLRPIALKDRTAERPVVEVSETTEGDTTTQTPGQASSGTSTPAPPPSSVPQLPGSSVSPPTSSTGSSPSGGHGG